MGLVDIYLSTKINTKHSKRKKKIFFWGNMQTNNRKKTHKMEGREGGREGNGRGRGVGEKNSSNPKLEKKYFYFVISIISKSYFSC